jgi:preprotein translocase subunit SecD
VHLDDAAARAMQDFTREPEGRAIAVVVGGKVACAHGIRSQLKGDALGVSCCNPPACDVWASLVRHDGP